MSTITLAFAAFLVLATVRLACLAADRRWRIRERGAALWAALVRLADAMLDVARGEPDFRNPIIVATLAYVDTFADKELRR